MHPRMVELIDYLDMHRSALRAAVDAVPSDLLEQRPAPERWSVAEVLEHLSLVERRLGALFAERIAAAREQGLGAEQETSSILSSLDIASLVDRERTLVAPETARPRGEVDAETAWKDLDAARQNLREMIIASDGLALGEVLQMHGRLGELNMYQWVLFVGGHEARHTGQIREIAARLAERVE